MTGNLENCALLFAVQGKRKKSRRDHRLKLIALSVFSQWSVGCFFNSRLQ
jgi:hypothetical protein